MRHIVVGCLASLFLAFPAVLWAKDQIIPVQTGQPAPAEGYFVPNGHLVEALAQSAELRKLMEIQGLEVQSLREQIRLTDETWKERARIQVEAEKEKAKIEIEALRAKVADLEKQVYSLEHPVWYKTLEANRIFGAAMTLIPIVVGALLR